MKDLCEIAVAVIIAQDEVLVQKRSEQDQFAGLWEFPGGKIKKGESALEAAVREVFEETGILLDSILPLWEEIIRFQYPEKDLKLHFFCFELDKRPEISQKGPIWINVHELSERVMPPANQQIVDRLIESQ